MRRILDHAQSVRGGNPIERIHIDGQSGEMHRHDGARLGADRGSHQIHVEVARVQVDIDEYRSCTQPRHHIRARGKAHRRNDDFVALADAGDLERHFEPRGRRGHDAHMTVRAQIRGERRLEGLNLGAARELPGAKHVGDRGDALRIDRRPRKGKKGLQIDVHVIQLIGAPPAPGLHLGRPPASVRPAF